MSKIRETTRMLSGLIALMRPAQWTKNLACLAAVFFSGNIDNPSTVASAALASAAFCMLSSTAYILNDFMDREADRRHSVKRERPLAKRSVGLREAGLLALALAAGTALLLWRLAPGVAWAAGAYLGLNIIYSLGGKRVVVLDVLLIALGFVLRLLAGAAACQVVASDWMLACGFSLALFIGCAKRRSELVASHQGTTRLVLRDYSIELLDKMCTATLTLTLCSYLLFAVLAYQGKGLLVTFPPVVFGTFRYLYLLNERERGETPELVLLHDLPIQAAILAWAGIYTLLLYGPFGG